MKQFCLLCFCLLPLYFGGSALQQNIARPDIIRPDFGFLPHGWLRWAKQHQTLTGCPASVSIAQALLETGDAKSKLYRKTRNCFCIKDWSGRGYRWHDDKPTDRFKVYASDSLAWRDRLLTLQKPRWQYLIHCQTEADWTNGLQAFGWATDRKYSQKLRQKIQQYQLDLIDSMTYETYEN